MFGRTHQQSHPACGAVFHLLWAELRVGQPESPTHGLHLVCQTDACQVGDHVTQSCSRHRRYSQGYPDGQVDVFSLMCSACVCVCGGGGGGGRGMCVCDIVCVCEVCDVCVGGRGSGVSVWSRG